MTLNIKNPEVHKLATRLARLRNVSTTQAVLDAVKGDLAREEKSRKKAGLARQLVEIGQRCAKDIRQPFSSADHAAMLYDERGLPKRARPSQAG